MRPPDVVTGFRIISPVSGPRSMGPMAFCLVSPACAGAAFLAAMILLALPVGWRTGLSKTHKGLIEGRKEGRQAGKGRKEYKQTCKEYI